MPLSSPPCPWVVVPLASSAGLVYEGAHVVRATVHIVASLQLFISTNDDGTRYVSGPEQIYTPRELWPRTPDSD